MCGIDVLVVALEKTWWRFHAGRLSARFPRVSATDRNDLETKARTKSVNNVVLSAVLDSRTEVNEGL